MVEVQDVINLRKGNMSVPDYFSKFTLLSMNAPSLVPLPFDDISTFLAG